MFNAQSLRSKRFHEVSENAAKSEASSVVWMQATANGSQVFVALSTVVVLVVGIGFSASFGLTFAGRPIWGFKEVRYGLPDVLLLRELFPQLRVVHVVRDPRDVLCSLDEWERSGGWSRVETERSLRHWLSVAGSFAATGTDPHLRSFILPVRYEDLVHFSQWWTNAVAEHCNLEADLLDKSVFDQWVHTAGPRGRADRQLREWSDLPASLRALIDDEDIQMVASTYGYDLSS
jgi:hypothetical protein